jgi:hypothetical protein
MGLNPEQNNVCHIILLLVVDVEIYELISAGGPDNDKLSMVLEPSFVLDNTADFIPESLPFMSD